MNIKIMKNILPVSKEELLSIFNYSKKCLHEPCKNEKGIYIERVDVLNNKYLFSFK